MSFVPRTAQMLTAGLLSLLAFAVRADGQIPATPLTRLQFDIVGVRLVVDPPALTVPKNIGTQINTSLVLPPGIGAEARDAILSLTAGAVVEAELRGPSIPPTRITVTPGQPLPVPPLALSGDYFLDGIRLARNGQTILDATASDARPATTIPIKVISEVFVTTVTSRPLSLDEIRGKGIVIDQGSFQAVNFQVAFNIDGSKFTIDLPAALPTPELLKASPDRTKLIQTLSVVNKALAATQTKLPPEFDRPGLNFSIAALPFFPVPDDDGSIPSLDIPPVTGLVVIPGNVAFLNQIFSVLLLVTNVAPDGSLLELHEVKGTITLPKGSDRVAGTFDQPGDDPLRLARIEGIGTQPTVPVVQLGPDGKLGTTDDIAVIPPLRAGQGEFLVEGLQEGAHLFDITIDAVLQGLPSGPVRLAGQAAGAVFVRNPTFAVTLAHPRTIRSGEPYDLYATITNTSRSAANLVSVNLDPRGISGARLSSADTVAFESIGPGQAVTAKFSLVAQQTGGVTASSFTGEAAAGGGIRLVTGVGERGVPLAANAIVLPKTADNLPPALVAAAQRVLGQAFSIATAPSQALPEGVLFVKRETVVDRGVELAEAGERVGFGEPIGRVVEDLLLDWLGNSALDEGFDQLMRTTDAGAAFLEEIARIIGPDATGGAALDYQLAFARATVARLPHVSAIAGGPAGTPRPSLRVTRGDGAIVGLSHDSRDDTLIGAAPLALDGQGAAGAYAVLGRVESQLHTFEMTAAAAGAYDLGLIVPGGGGAALQQLRYPAIALDAGGSVRVQIDLSASGSATLRIDRNGDGSIDATAAPQILEVSEGAPQLVSVQQLSSSFRAAAGDPTDPASYGLLLGALFDRPVTKASAELKSNYSIESNAVIGAQLQSSGRLVYLYLQKPVGGLKPRSLTVSGIEDDRGSSLGSAVHSIATVFSDGGHVFGQVRSAEGQPVPQALLRLTIVDDANHSFDVSTLNVDRNGSFDFDFVPRIGQRFVLTVQHPSTKDLASISARLRGAGEQLLLNPTFTGRGTVRGRLLSSDGVTVLPGVPVALIPGAVLGTRGFQVSTDPLGAFVFTDVPVGIFTLTASDGRRGFAQAPGLVPSSGQLVSQDLVLLDLPEEGGRLVGRVFLADGTTPASGFIVYAGRYRRDNGSIEAVAQTTTDQTGSFAFDRVLPVGSYDVVALDPGTQQVGSTRTSVAANLISSVSIALDATGTVEGVVFNGLGQPVPGALVAGGVALGQADANGFFRIEGVPAGSRTIDAGDPVTRRRGSAQVTVLPGQTVRAAVTLESRATIVGRVLDANGNPVPRASVRIPQLGGFRFVIANNQGVFTFPDLELGDHLLEAPGPSADSLISFMEANGLDPASAFTSGDGPGGTAPPTLGDANAVLKAYEKAVQAFFSVDQSLLGLPTASLGGFGWNSVKLFQDSTTVTADIKFLQQGAVSGHTADGAGRPTGALVRITGLAVGLSGGPVLAELGRMNSDAATGTFGFSGIPRFDLATFQTTGIRAGDFTVEAAQQFSPAIVSFRGQLNTSTPDVHDVVLQFPAVVETNGTVSGRVLLPDGVTPAPANTEVQISFGDLTVRTDADGRFASLLPIPAGRYTLTARAPSGLRAQILALVPAGGNVDTTIRLLGLGSVTVQVKRPNGVPVASATVHVDRASFPNDAVQGMTDANGLLRFDNLTEGPFGAVAEEPGTGLSGRASGAVVGDAAIPLPVVITGSGVVTGTFVAASDGQPIPFAQVTLSATGARAFGATDAAGRFELPAIPVGSFSVEANDPATGRLGRASGELRAEGQVVDVTIVQLPRGTISGLVVNANGVAPVAGARVELAGQGIVRTQLQATAREDGSFHFEGVPSGPFDLTAVDPVSGFKGTGHGSIAVEGEVVEHRITLEPFGALRVQVVDAQGHPASNLTISISGGESRTAAPDPSGAFTFEFLRLAEYRIVARSLSDSGDGGETTVKLDAANATVDATVHLRGSGDATITVVAADGITRVASARVTLTAKAAFGNEPPGPVTTTLTGFTGGDGTVTFDNVPIGDFFALGESAALAGIAIGTVAAPGQTTAATVQLGASGAVAGRVLLPDGATPAAQAIVTLRFQSQSQLQSGVLQVTTGLGGTFEFGGIPLGTFSLSAFEVVSHGSRNAGGSLGTNGQRVDLGDLSLDNSGPRIVSITPADGSSDVPAGSPIVITFDEPIAPASLLGGAGANANLLLLDGATRVDLAASLGNGNRTLTVQPSQPLHSSVRYSLTVKGVPDGPQNEAGLSLPDSFVSTFTVRDLIAPFVVAASPAAEAQQVQPDASIRVTFSEVVARATMTLRDAAGAIVPGQSALALGNSVSVFSPQDFLRPNTSYAVTVSNVADPAGNALVGGTFTARFFTVDTIAPIITALQAGGVARAGATISVRPTIIGDDTARVEYVIGGGQARTSASSPFAIDVALPTSSPALAISATAVDAVGNRSPAFSRSIDIQPNQPPVVSVAPLGGSTFVTQGQTLRVQVNVTDDDQLAQVLFSAVGAATVSSTRPVPAGQSTFGSTFDVPIPATAASGTSVTVQAAAFDSAGNQSNVATLTLPVRDGLKPGLTVLTPVNNAQVLPGQTMTETFDATDDVGLASVALVCSPALSGCESRPLPGGERSTHQSFSFVVPASLQAPATIDLLAVATDTSGNTTQVGRSIRIVDTARPTISTLESVSGSSRVVAGSTVTLRASVADNVGVTRITFLTEGGVTTSGTQPVSPPVTSGIATFSFAVPADAANGSAITVHARVADAVDNVSDEAVLVLSLGDTAAPTIEVLAPAAGTSVAPGDSVTLRVRASDDVGVSRVVFGATGVFVRDETATFSPPVTPADAAFVVSLPAATVPGMLTLTARAVDAAGNTSAEARRDVTVRDVTAPTVTISLVGGGSTVDPRSPVQVFVTAHDDLGVGQVRLTASGVQTVDQTRPQTQPATSVSETFTITLLQPPPAGGTLALAATAVDTTGNLGAAANLNITVLDVVAPLVTEVSPANSATNVDPGTAIVVSFSEAMDRASLTPTSIRLAAGANPVASAVAVAQDDRSVTLTPAAALAVNTAFTLTVDAAVRDRAGNTLAAPLVSTFRTSSPDATPPRVSRIDPPNGATGVGTATPIAVTFDEPIDPVTITAGSFRVSVASATVSGSFAFLNGNTVVRFTPAAALPFQSIVTTQLSSAITDAAHNPLADDNGAAIGSTPLTFTFTTGNFAIVSPAESAVIENSTISLEAQGGAGLNIASVVFSVNGAGLPAAVAAPFRIPFTVPAAAATPRLTIVASARDAQNTEIATAQKIVDVVEGLRAVPSVLGLPRGATSRLRLTLAHPAPDDLSIGLTVVDFAVVSLGSQSIVLHAGDTSVDVLVTACATCPGDPAPRLGAAVGNTAIVATSARGSAVAIISVSDRITGQSLAPFAGATGLSIALPPSAGQLITTAGQSSSQIVVALGTPADSTTAVSVTSNNPAVATATATDVQAGQQTTTLSLSAHSNGIAVLTLRAGSSIRLVTVFVGPQAPNLTPLALARPAGLSIALPPSAGQIISVAARTSVVTTLLLTSPLAGSTPLAVSVASSNSAVAVATATPIQPGTQVTTLTIQVGVEGTAVLTLRAGAVVRSLTVIAGTPAPNQTPIVLAPPAGVSVAGLPFIGQAFAPVGTHVVLGLVLLPAPAVGTRIATVASNNPAVAQVVSASVPIADGSRVAAIEVNTGTAGSATLTLTLDGLRRVFTIVVGTTPSPGQTAVAVAPAVGVSVVPSPGTGRVLAPAGSPVAATLGIQLLTVARTSEVSVTVTSSNPGVVTFGGSASVVVAVHAGELVAQLPIVTSGAEGAAVLTFEFDGRRLELLVVVGNVAPAQTPAVVAPVVGVRVQ